MSKMIVIEGPDGCGKATQCRLLKEYLLNDGHRAITIEVPIKDNHTYRLIYWMLESGFVKKFPRLFQSIQFLNRWLFQTFQLSKFEHKYDYMIFDRWSLSTTIYGQATGLQKKFLDSLYRNLRKSDFTLVLLGNSLRECPQDSYESDSKLQEDVRKFYLAWVLNHQQESQLIQCQNSREIVAAEIIKSLKSSGVIR